MQVACTLKIKTTTAAATAGARDVSRRCADDHVRLVRVRLRALGAPIVFIVDPDKVGGFDNRGTLFGLFWAIFWCIGLPSVEETRELRLKLSLYLYVEFQSLQQRYIITIIGTVRCEPVSKISVPPVHLMSDIGSHRIVHDLGEVRMCDNTCSVLDYIIYFSYSMFPIELATYIRVRLCNTIYTDQRCSPSAADADDDDDDDDH